MSFETDGGAFRFLASLFDMLLYMEYDNDEKGNKVASRFDFIFIFWEKWDQWKIMDDAYMDDFLSITAESVVLFPVWHPSLQNRTATAICVQSSKGKWATMIIAKIQ